MCAPFPSLPVCHTHLLPRKGCDEGQAALLLQLLPLGLPVEVLVPPATTEKQEVSWGRSVASGLGSPPRPSPPALAPPCPGPWSLTSLTLGHSLLDGRSEGGHASARPHHYHRRVCCLWEGQAPRPYPQGYLDRSCCRRGGGMRRLGGPGPQPRIGRGTDGKPAPRAQHLSPPSERRGHLAQGAEMPARRSRGPGGAPGGVSGTAPQPRGSAALRGEPGGRGQWESCPGGPPGLLPELQVHPLRLGRSRVWGASQPSGVLPSSPAERRRWRRLAAGSGG